MQARGAPVCDTEAIAGGSNTDAVWVGYVRGRKLLLKKRLLLRHHCVHIFVHSGAGSTSIVLCGMQGHVAAIPTTAQVPHHQIHCLLDLLASTTAFKYYMSNSLLDLTHAYWANIIHPQISSENSMLSVTCCRYEERETETAGNTLTEIEIREGGMLACLPAGGSDCTAGEWRGDQDSTRRRGCAKYHNLCGDAVCSHGPLVCIPLQCVRRGKHQRPRKPGTQHSACTQLLRSCVWHNASGAVLTYYPSGIRGLSSQVGSTHSLKEMCTDQINWNQWAQSMTSGKSEASFFKIPSVLILVLQL